MTKQHFIALADALRAQQPAEHWDANKLVQWNLDLVAVAKVCAAFNPRFDRDLWFDYVYGRCGPNRGKR